MSTIPISLTEDQFNEHVRPYLSTAKRGFVCKIPLYKVFNYILYRFYTGCQWLQVPIEQDTATRQKEISPDAIYYHFRKWSRDGSLTKVWEGSIMTITPTLNLSELNLDGSHASPRKVGKPSPIKGGRKPKPVIFCRLPMPKATSSPRPASLPAIITMRTT